MATLFGKPKGDVIKKPGELHRNLGIPQGKKIPSGVLARAASRGGKVGERARLAETMKSWH
jgi:hypothetical protein